jgi:octaprenyl-diphosphate synthase
MSALARQLAVETPQTLQTFFQKEMTAVNQIIDEELGSTVNLINLVGRHIYGAGGKRMRPLFTLASAALFGEISQKVLCLAAAVELIHTATLLHDDVIDNSTTRRGEDTANIRWGNTVSVLVGDYIFSKAFQLMVKAGDMTILDILSRTSSKIAEGEVWQTTTLNTLNLSRASYRRIIEAKTASLFAAACQVGGMVNGCTSGQAQTLWEIGQSAGVAFQIVDDVLDYDIQNAQTGKECGNDFFEGKLTLPVIMVLEADIEKDFWHDTFCNGNRSQQDLLKAISILENQGALGKTLDCAHAEVQKALTGMANLPHGQVNHLLYEAIHHSAGRKI